MSIEFRRLVVEELMKPIVFFFGAIGKFYRMLFGHLDVRLSQEYERELEQDIRREISFLFDEKGGRIVANPGARYPRSFDYAAVRVAAGNLLFSFTRGRCELTVRVCSVQHPMEWAELQWALASLQKHEQFELNAFSSLRDVAEALGPRINDLEQAYSEEHYNETRRFVVDIKDHERAVAKQLSSEINRRLQG